MPADREVRLEDLIRALDRELKICGHGSLRSYVLERHRELLEEVLEDDEE